MKDLEENDTQESMDRKPSADETKKRIEELKTRKEIYKNYKHELKETVNNEISTKDPDARLMAMNNNGIDMCYNIQPVVDSK